MQDQTRLTDAEFAEFRRQNFTTMTGADVRRMTKKQRREAAEYEASADMRKSFKELLINIHEELTADREMTDNQLHANKRLSSLTALNSQKAHSAMKLALVISVAALIVAIVSWICPLR